MTTVTCAFHKASFAPFFYQKKSSHLFLLGTKSSKSSLFLSINRIKTTQTHLFELPNHLLWYFIQWEGEMYPTIVIVYFDDKTYLQIIFGHCYLYIYTHTSPFDIWLPSFIWNSVFLRFYRSLNFQLYSSHFGLLITRSNFCRAEVHLRSHKKGSLYYHQWIKEALYYIEKKREKHDLKEK